MDDPGAAGSVRTLVRSRSSCQATGIDVDDDAGRVVRSAALWPQQLGAPVGAHLQRGLAGVTRGVPLSRLWRQLRAARTERDFALSHHLIDAHHRLDVHHAQRHRRRSVDRQRKVPEKSAPLTDPPGPALCARRRTRTSSCPARSPQASLALRAAWSPRRALPAAQPASPAHFATTDTHLPTGSHLPRPAAALCQDAQQTSR